MKRYPKVTASKAKLESVGHELKVNPPKVLAITRRKKGDAAAEKQRKAILIAKAMRANGY